MSTQLTYNQVVELLPAYALGVLDPDELLAVDAVVQQHPDLRVRLAAIDTTIAQLAYAAPDAGVPPTAKQQVVARVRAAQEPSPYATRTLDPTTSLPVAAIPWAHQPAPRTATSTRPRSGAPPWTQRLRTWRVPVAAGVLGATLLLGLGAAYVQTRLDHAAAQVATMHDAVVGLQQQQHQDRQVLAQMVCTEPEQVVKLPGTAQAPAASGELCVRNGTAILIADGLAPLPPSHTYQVWLVLDGTPTPFGLLQADPAGRSYLPLVIPPEAQDFAIVDVSVEQAGGSQTITKETIVLRGSVS